MWFLDKEQSTDAQLIFVDDEPTEDVFREQAFIVDLEERSFTVAPGGEDISVADQDNIDVTLPWTGWGIPWKQMQRHPQFVVFDNSLYDTVVCAAQRGYDALSDTPSLILSHYAYSGSIDQPYNPQQRSITLGEIIVPGDLVDCFITVMQRCGLQFSAGPVVAPQRRESLASSLLRPR